MAELTAVLAALEESLPALAEATAGQIFAEISTYARVEPAALESAVARNLQTSLIALRQERVPATEALQGASQTALERYAKGVPIEDVVRGFRISISMIHERFVDLGIAMGLPGVEVVAGSKILWDLGDAYTTRIITAYHDLQLDAALREARHRAGVVRALVAGRLPEEAIRSGINVHNRYAVIRCEPAEAAAEPIRRTLERSGSSFGSKALVAVDGTTVLGLVAQRPAPLGIPVGMGPFVAFDELARSDRIAGEALDLAQRLGRTGIQSVSELGWRLAAVSRPDAWAHYADRFLVPLAAEETFADEILAAVRAWLHHGQSAQRAAEQLVVHVNTVRYRLRRFGELTGADLADPDDLVGIIWVLELGDPRTPNP